MDDRSRSPFPPPTTIGEYLARERVSQGFLPQDADARAPGGPKASSNPFHPEAKQVQTGHPLGALYEHYQHGVFESFERLYRAEASDSFYDPNRSPSNPFIFTVGSFKVPRDLALWIFEYEFSAAKVVGNSAGDTIPLEEERMGTEWCFDLNVDGIRKRQCEYDIDPVPIQTQGEGFEVVSGGVRGSPPSLFNRAAARSFAVVGGPGRAALPFRSEHFGPSGGHPFTVFVPPNQILEGRCIIFRPLEVPLAYVQMSIKGFLFPPVLLERFAREAQP